MIHSIRSKIVLVAACAVLPATGLFAQAPAAASTPSVSVPAATDTTAATTVEGKHGGKMKEKLASLTPEERQKLLAARKKAMEDPAVKAAEATRDTDRKGYRKALTEAMLRADPSVAPILEKMRAEGKPGKKDASARKS